MLRRKRLKPENAGQRRDFSNRPYQSLVFGAVAGSLAFVASGYGVARAAEPGALGRSALWQRMIIPITMSEADQEAQALGSSQSGQPFDPWQSFQPRQPGVRKPPAARESTYRTLCVRTCDGYYFPISYATSRNRFKVDAAVCQSMYPPGGAALYVHRTMGEDATQAVSLAGEPLVRQSFAFAYRSVYNPSCAALLHPGSGTLVSVNKPPLQKSVALPAPAGMVPSPKLPDASTAVAATLDQDAPSTDGAGEAQSPPKQVRLVGPTYDETSNLSATEGEPSRLADPGVASRPVISSEEPSLASSIPFNPFKVFGRQLASPAPTPEADQAN